MLEDRDFFVTDSPEAILDPQDLFGNSHPLFIEIGSGKGEFISQYSILHPDWNFLGFEAAEKRIRNILKKISPERHPNVRIVRLRVDANIAQVLAPESVQGVFIQHPDPWPKKRHHKRRLFQQDFLNALAAVMRLDSEVHVSTDHEEYANWIAEEFAHNPNFISMLDQVIQTDPSLDDHVSTWYELEQKRLGFTPNFMLFKKI
ncbi:MAG: tRNA (guanosine(46)-N7)-methyltransferase TrmB [Candidatus Syntrophosphaera sp.]|nr:tRNA (guanosine(46)-N7)-methyltransferase TrmB [Candidatus Syntrophosphaera sp.]